MRCTRTCVTVRGVDVFAFSDGLGWLGFLAFRVAHLPCSLLLSMSTFEKLSMTCIRPTFDKLTMTCIRSTFEKLSMACIRSTFKLTMTCIRSTVEKLSMTCIKSTFEKSSMTCNRSTFDKLSMKCIRFTFRLCLSSVVVLCACRVLLPCMSDDQSQIGSCFLPTRPKHDEHV